METLNGAVIGSKKLYVGKAGEFIGILVFAVFIIWITSVYIIQDINKISMIHSLREQRLDLEKRMGLQLDQAVLDDLLIPSFLSSSRGTLYDVDTVQRIMKNFLDCEERTHTGYNTDKVCLSPLQSDMEHIGNLMEGYLAEIASDRNLTLSSFFSFAECMLIHSRATDDGIYRAIDIYLKAHPFISDTERKKVCSVMDCKKLSREACAHAAKNDRLPVQTVVQVLYSEQQRLQEVMDGSLSSEDSHASASKGNEFSKDVHPVPSDARLLEGDPLNVGRP